MSEGPYPDAAIKFPTIRQSRGVAFDSCALSMKFDADYRSHWSGHPQVRGTIMHRVFGQALAAMHAAGEKQIPQDAILAILADALRQDDVDRECPDCGAPIIGTSPAGVIECAHGHKFRGDFSNIPMSEIKDMRWVAVKWASNNQFDIEHLMDIEQRLHANIEYPDGEGGHVTRVLTGQMDAMFAPEPDHVIVLDWKDTWSLPAPQEVGFEGFAQQRWYAWLVMQNYKSIEKVTLREFYVRYSEYREATIHRYELPDVEQDLSALTERFDRSVQNNYFPPSPGRQCQFCARPAACPIFPGVRVEGAITDEKVAARFAAEAAVAKSALTQRTKAMQAWTSVHGAVPLNADKGRERQWGYVERKRTSRPTREELEHAMYVHGSHNNLDTLYKTDVVTKFEQHAPPQIEDHPADEMLMAALDASLKQQEAA